MEDFPYYHTFTDKKEILTRIDNLSKYEAVFENKDYHINNMPQLSKLELFYLPDQAPKVLVSDKEDYNKYNNISPYFTDECRILARRYDNEQNLLEFWETNKEKIKIYAQEKYGDTTPFNLRESIYNMFYEVGFFRPVNLVSIIDLYHAKKILDFSAGWGDRLIAALTKNVDYYCGVDPNECLHPKYAEIVKFFQEKGTTTKVDMIKSPFEKADVPIMDYDLIFTSPPYFNLEIYSDDETQSHHYNTLDKWYNEFLLTSIKKAWELLKNGGHMVIVINDFYDGAKYTERMIADINKFADTLYLGVISYADQIGDNLRSPQPMWIWKKQQIEKNPKVTLRPVSFKRDGIISVNVVADDLLPGGTKQRAWQFLADRSENELVYAGPYNGAAQCALAVIGKFLQKKVTIFLQYAHYIHPMTIKARMYGANIMFHNGDLKTIQMETEKYAEKKNAYVLPFGFDDKKFIVALYEQLKNNMPKINDNADIWLVGGSATLVNVLYEIFPKHKFHLVQVGKTIWPDQVNKLTTIYKAPEKFFEQATTQPPYPTVRSYDAKVWQFVLVGAKNGDLVWNVASEELPVIGGADIDFKKIYPHEDYWKQINVEYYRQKLIYDLLKYLYTFCKNNAEKYEMRNILERWLLSSANVAAETKTKDIVFADETFNIKHEVNQRFINEINEKKLTGAISGAYKILNEMLKRMNKFINSKELFENENLKNEAITVYNYKKYKLIQFKFYKREIATDRYEALLNRTNIENILIMALRYTSIISGSQHWQMPIEQYQYYLDKFHIDIEGFASPFNSQMLLLSKTGNFCSLFPDTDAAAGSIGSFYKADFQNKVVAVGPPYVIDVLNNMAKKCISECEKAEKLGNKVKLLITFSAWRDIEAYTSLTASKYLQYTVELAPLKHFYTDASDIREGKSRRVIARFYTVLFVLSYGYPKDDYSDLFKYMSI